MRCPTTYPQFFGSTATARRPDVANLNAWHAANPPNFIKDTNPATTDQEPGGVFHSMIASGKHLYVIETNRGFVLRVDPRTGVIEKLYDMSIDNREHNPIVMTRRGNNFFVGTFGEDGGPSELAVFDRHFSSYTLPFGSPQPDRRPGMAMQRSLWRRDLSPDNPWSTDTANLVRFDRGTGQRTTVLTGFASLPNWTRGRSRRCAVHVELGHLVRTRRRRRATHQAVSAASFPALAHVRGRVSHAQPSDLRTCSEFLTSFTPPTSFARLVARVAASAESTKPLNCTVPLNVSTLIW
jgi:hypothetical protein